MFGKINSFHILWSSILVAFSTKSTVTLINNFLLRFLFLNSFRNFFWKSIKWRWVWNSISRQVLINNNKTYPGFKYEANISIEFWTVRQTIKYSKNQGDDFWWFFKNVLMVRELQPEYVKVSWGLKECIPNLRLRFCLFETI